MEDIKDRLGEYKYNFFSDLQNYLTTNLLLYDIIIIHLTASYCIKSKYIPALIAKINAAYVTPTVLTYTTVTNPNTGYTEYIPATTSYHTTTYNYIEVTSPEIISFYKANLIKDIPYFLTFKKNNPNITQWWYPCKSVSCLAVIDDIILFIKSSVKL